MQIHLGGDILDRGRAAAATDGQNEASGIAGVRGKPTESFAFHTAPRTIDAAELELQQDRMPAAIQIAGLADDVVVRSPRRILADATDRFF
jgi:hypothetical protein